MLTISITGPARPPEEAAEEGEGRDETAGTRTLRSASRYFLYNGVRFLVDIAEISRGASGIRQRDVRSAAPTRSRHRRKTSKGRGPQEQYNRSEASALPPARELRHVAEGTGTVARRGEEAPPRVRDGEGKRIEIWKFSS